MKLHEVAFTSASSCAVDHLSFIRAVVLARVKGAITNSDVDVRQFEDQVLKLQIA